MLLCGLVLVGAAGCRTRLIEGDAPGRPDAALGFAVSDLAVRSAPDLPDTGPLWAAYGENARHTFRTQQPGPVAGRVLWTFQRPRTQATWGEEWRAVVGRDGTVYLPTEDLHVYALDGRTGAERWSFRAGSRIAGSMALMADGRVVVVTADRTVYALDGATGTPVWTARAGDPGTMARLPVPPTVGPDGTVYVATDDGVLTALAPGDGALRWTRRFEGPLFVPPAVGSDGTLFAPPSVRGGRGAIYPLHAIDAQGGHKWTFALPEPGMSVTVGEDGTVFVPSPNVGMTAIDGARGTQKWFLAGQVLNAPAIGTDNTLYYTVQQEPGLLAVDGATGRIKWRIAGGICGWKATWALDGDGTLYGLGCNDVLLSFDTTRGAPRPTFRLGARGENASSPVLGADRTLYVLGLSGTVYAVTE